MRKEIGRVTSKSAKLYIVLWDDKNREVWVQSVGVISNGPVLKCPSKAERAQDAMHVATAFLFDK